MVYGMTGSLVALTITNIMRAWEAYQYVWYVVSQRDFQTIVVIFASTVGLLPRILSIREKTPNPKGIGFGVRGLGCQVQGSKFKTYGNPESNGHEAETGLGFEFRVRVLGLGVVRR